MQAKHGAITPSKKKEWLACVCVDRYRDVRLTLSRARTIFALPAWMVMSDSGADWSTVVETSDETSLSLTIVDAQARSRGRYQILLLLLLLPPVTTNTTKMMLFFC